MADREQRPSDLCWDVLVEFFGEPRMKTERSMFGKVVRELMEAGATPDEVRKACIYVRASFDTPSVMAIPKWFTVAQMAPAKMSPQEQALDRIRRQGI